MTGSEPGADHRGHDALHRATFVYDAEGAVLAVTGELRPEDVDSLASFLREAVAGGDLVLDLNAVTYLPSAAVGVIARAVNGARDRGSRLHLVTEPDTIAGRVLAITGIATSPRGPSS